MKKLGVGLLILKRFKSIVHSICMLHSICILVLSTKKNEDECILLVVTTGTASRDLFIKCFSFNYQMCDKTIIASLVKYSIIHLKSHIEVC